MEQSTASAADLVAAWTRVRGAFKLREHELSAEEAAGLLIQELGGTEAALRLVRLADTFHWILRLKFLKPGQLRPVEDLLLRAWVLEQPNGGPTLANLEASWRNRPADFDPDSSLDAWILAGGIVASGQDLRRYTQQLGKNLYNYYFFVGDGFATHPKAAEVLFLLETGMRLQRRGSA